MRRWMSLSLMTLVITSAAFAQDAKLRRLDTGVQASAWEAVGRLDIAGASFCTGALVAPNQVLTAAHCLFDKDTQELISPDKIEFRAGWRNGRASAYRRVKRAAIHPDYDYQGELEASDVRNDVAILELDHPIRDGRILPFETSVQPEVGARVGVVSYAKQRSDAPSLQEVCEVIAKRDGVLVTSCSADFGASGAPIFVFGEGTARIASVVSAKAEMSGEPVSLGVSLEKLLNDLQTELATQQQRLTSSGGALQRRAAGEPKSETGAKFVRP